MEPYALKMIGNFLEINISISFPEKNLPFSNSGFQKSINCWRCRPSKVLLVEQVDAVADISSRRESMSGDDSVNRTEKDAIEK